MTNRAMETNNPYNNTVCTDINSFVHEYKYKWKKTSSYKQLVSQEHLHIYTTNQFFIPYFKENHATFHFLQDDNRLVNI